MQRLGVLLNPHDCPRRETIAVAKRADELGYTALWLGESWGHESFSLLTEMALCTRHIKLGPGVTSIWARTPGNTAQTLASLDDVSDGRARLGLGISGRLVTEGWHGLKWEKPFRRTREYVDIIRLAIAGERVNYDGEIFRLRDFRLKIQPPRKRIPIYIGAFGPRNVREAGTYADGWLTGDDTPEHFGELLKGLVEGAESAGRRRSDLDVSCHASLVAVADNSTELGELRDMARRNLGYYIAGLGEYHADAAVRQGYAAEVAAARERWQAGDREGTTAAVSDRMVDSLATVGSAAEVRQRLDDYFRQGTDEVCISFPSQLPLEDRMRTLRALAPA